MFLDEVLEVEPLKKLQGRMAHKGRPSFASGGISPGGVLPGVLMAESLAQAGRGIQYFIDENYRGRLAVFGGIDKMKFRGMVLPAIRCCWSPRNDRVSASGVKDRVKASVEGKNGLRGGGNV